MPTVAMVKQAGVVDMSVVNPPLYRSFHLLCSYGFSGFDSSIGTKDSDHSGGSNGCIDSSGYSGFKASSVFDGCQACSNGFYD